MGLNRMLQNMFTVYDAYYIDNITTISIGLDSVQLYTIYNYVNLYTHI